jgi:hypothetical protein
MLYAYKYVKIHNLFLDLLCFNSNHVFNKTIHVRKVVWMLWDELSFSFSMLTINLRL